jgi:DNA-binding CsgD family transcriptional regulator
MDLEYNNISSRLLIEFPTLSSRDIQVCCLLLANFDTGMIAIILDLKIESMNTYRYRLRTKFGLTNPDNLMDYLRNF